MRRQSLIWFAAGCLIGNLAWAVSLSLWPDEAEEFHLIVFDKYVLDEATATGLSSEEYEIELSSVRVLNQCGIPAFLNEWSGGSHTVPSNAISIEDTSERDLDCVIQKSREEGFKFSIKSGTML